jgi:hypothetical protein
VRAKHAKAVLLDDPPERRQQVIVAAAKRGENPRQQRQRLEVRPDPPERWPGQGADEHDIPASAIACKSIEAAELAEASPLMRVGLHSRFVGVAAQRIQKDFAAAAASGIGHGKRQASARAIDRERAVAAGFGGLVHDDASLSARRTAMVSGRFAARMNSTILATKAFAPYEAATWSKRC